MEIDNNYAWSTHQPLIKLILKVFNPQFILEMGIGIYSTPFFIQHNCKRLFIENSSTWIDFMNLPNEKILLHEIDVLSQDIAYNVITDMQKRNIASYYNLLKLTIQEYSQPRLLFVDNYSCCRALAINTLYPEFDLIIYHDCEPQSIERNNYYFDKELIMNYAHYNLVTPRTWTGCFIRNEMNDENLLMKTIQPIIDEYCKENNITDIYLRK